MKSGDTFWTAQHFKIGEADDERDYEGEVIGAKILGRYSTRAKAEAAVARLIGLEGFRDYPGGFRIYEEVVDRDRRDGENWLTY